MPKLYCQSCGEITDWTSVKPATCPLCSESYVKRIEPKAATTARKVVSLMPDQQSVEEASEDSDIPLTFDIRGEGQPKTIISVGANGVADIRETVVERVKYRHDR